MVSFSFSIFLAGAVVIIGVVSLIIHVMMLFFHHDFYVSSASRVSSILIRDVDYGMGE